MIRDGEYVFMVVKFINSKHITKYGLLNIQTSKVAKSKFKTLDELQRYFGSSNDEEVESYVIHSK